MIVHGAVTHNADCGDSHSSSPYNIFELVQVFAVQSEEKVAGNKTSQVDVVFLCVCTCVCVCACMRGCMRAGMCACVCTITCPIMTTNTTERRRKKGRNVQSAFNGISKWQLIN